MLVIEPGPGASRAPICASFIYGCLLDPMGRMLAAPSRVVRIRMQAGPETLSQSHQIEVEKHTVVCIALSPLGALGKRGEARITCDF